MIFISTLTFIAGSLITLWFIDSKVIKVKNKVHFYVARDKDKTLWLYIGRPIKDEVFKSFTFNERGGVIMSWNWFERLGLNRDDYKDLKWEDGPKEVFLNLEE